MTCETELRDLIDTGRRILQQGCKQQPCDEWRQRAFPLLCELLGPRHEHSRLFQSNDCCGVKSLVMRVEVLTRLEDMVSQGHVPVRIEPAH
jgi:hypothetical protein